MNSKILINKDYLLENELSSEALLVFIELKIKYRKPEIYFNSTLLSIYAFGEDFTDKQRNIIVKGFNELVDSDIIKINKNIRNEIFICDISEVLKIEKHQFYLSIYMEEFSKIINLNDNVNVCRVLKYFLNLIGTFDAREKTDVKYRHKIGSSSQKTLSNLCKIDVATMIKYNKILEKNKIIHITKRKAAVVNQVQSGRIFKQVSNVYSRYEDKKLCEEYIKEQGFIKNDKVFVNVVNEMRSLSQKYNYFARVYKEKQCEDLDKVQAAYEAGKQWNEYAKQDFEQSVKDGKKVDEPKYKDLSIFDQYGLTI